MELNKSNFIKGFKKNSLVLLIAALVLALIIAYFASDILENGFEKGFILNFSLENLLSSEEDFATYTTYKLYELKENPPETETIYLLGGSSARECLTSYQSLEEKINAVVDEEINVEFLTLNVISIMDIVQIVENLPEDSGTVVLGLSSRNITQRELFNNIYIKSDIYTDYYMNNDYIKAIHGELELTKPIYSLMWMNKVISNFMENPRFIFQKKEINFHSFADDDDKLDFYSYIYYEQEKQLTGDDEDYEFFIELINVIIDVAEERGLDVVIWDTPYYTDALGDMVFEEGTLYTYYQQAIAELTATRDIGYFDYIDDLDLSEEDFWDIVHIKSESAQQAVEDGFAQSFKEFIESN